MLADDMGRFFADPLGFVMYAFDWNRDPDLQLVPLQEPWRSRYCCEWGPDRWACEFLDDLGFQIATRHFDGINSVDPIREAIVSGHGIGKSALIAWLNCFIMSTRPYCQGTVTANTATQLATKTWPQITKWMRKCITAHWFDWSSGRGAMKMWRRGMSDSWYCSAQTCDEENSEAFAGQHAATSTSFYLFDEASAIPLKIHEVSDGGLTDGEPMKFAFGNGTLNQGWFYDCFNAQRHRWGTRQVDSREVHITNKRFIDELIADYGLDSDFVKIRVRGMFPSASSKQLISTADVDAAMARTLRPEQFDFAPKVLTLDNAWEGDDEGVIGLRQGLSYRTLRVFAKNDNDIEIANLMARLEDEHEVDAVHIDAGYGTGVVSAGKTMGRDWKLVWFAGEAPDPGCVNLRAWIWLQARDWLKAGGALDPKDKILYSDLLGPQTVPRMDGKLQLEAKKDMKRRGLASPGRGDALALSFAYPVVRKQHNTPFARVMQQAGHDPYVVMPGARETVAAREHDPYDSLR